LALAHHAKPTQGVGILRLFTQACLECLLGAGQVVAIQGLEAPGEVGVLLEGRRLCRARAIAQLITDFLVVRVALR
jgi:hypothetical protein